MNKSLISLFVILLLVNLSFSIGSECKNPPGNDCEWYSNCLNKATTTSCPFINNTMKNKCNVFKRLDSSLSPLAQKWSSHVRSCLQKRLASQTLASGSTTCKKATDNFFDFHADCYFKGPVSFCKLDWDDQLRIVLSGADMIFSRHGMEVAKIANEIRKYCF